MAGAYFLWRNCLQNAQWDQSLGRILYQFEVEMLQGILKQVCLQQNLKVFFCLRHKPVPFNFIQVSSQKETTYIMGPKIGKGQQFIDFTALHMRGGIKAFVRYRIKRTDHSGYIPQG